jgi:hypothetical protein
MRKINSFAYPYILVLAGYNSGILCITAYLFSKVSIQNTKLFQEIIKQKLNTKIMILACHVFIIHLNILDTNLFHWITIATALLHSVN